MGLVVTHSDIKTFLTCRRKWYWSYVLDFAAPERRTGALALGNRVHASLEEYYRDGRDPVEVHDRLGMEAVEAINDDPTAKPWELDELYKDMITGRKCIVHHQDWLEVEGADANFEVVDVEQTIQADILDGRITLRGKVDTLFREIDTGFIYCNDLKTSANRPIREELERSFQHHVYLAVLRLARPADVVHGAFYTVMYKNSRSKRVERFPVPAASRMAVPKLRQIEAICSEMLRSIDLIEHEGAANAYPHPQDACRWCAYRQPCEVFDESPVAARQMLDDNFRRGGRFKRYDGEQK